VKTYKASTDPDYEAKKNGTPRLSVGLLDPFPGGIRSGEGDRAA